MWQHGLLENSLERRLRFSFPIRSDPKWERFDFRCLLVRECNLPNDDSAKEGETREGGRGCANIAFAKDKLRRYVDDPLIASFATLALLARLKRGGRQREPRGKRGGGQAPEKCL